MDEDEIQLDVRRKRPGTESFTTLARRPLVQLLLVVTALAQVVNVRAVGVEGEVGFQRRVAEVELGPLQVVADSALQMAWLEKAITREAERLGAEYREQGFNVSPALAKQIGEAAAEYQIS